jgi:hypothetical protein
MHICATIAFFSLILYIIIYKNKQLIFKEHARVRIEEYVNNNNYKLISCSKSNLYYHIKFGWNSKNTVYDAVVQDKNGKKKECWIILTNNFFEEYGFEFVWKDTLLDSNPL